MDFTIHEKNNYFSMPMSYYEGDGINNELARNKRFCLILIESGTGNILRNGKSIFFISPVVFCVNEEEYVIIEGKEDIKISAIYFHPKVINDSFEFEYIKNLPSNASISVIQDFYWTRIFLDNKENLSGKITIDPISCNRIKRLMEDFERETSLQNRDNWPCRSRSYIMEILFLLDKLYDDSQLTELDYVDTSDNEVTNILGYLYNNYDKKITITDITKEFNINRTTLSVKFHEAVGETIMSYLNKLRVNIAVTMLQDTGLPVAEIMERVGFSDSAHFFRTFKKYTGLSPKAYREKYCWLKY